MAVSDWSVVNQISKTSNINKIKHDLLYAEYRIHIHRKAMQKKYYMHTLVKYSILNKYCTKI
jgi:hypothetical protein